VNNKVTNIEHVEKFLNDFHLKSAFYDIVFRNDRDKNIHTLLKLAISSLRRKEIIAALRVEDYSEGPLPDTLHHISDMWVFGILFKKQEIYIKISMGRPSSQTICISFHIADRKMNYPFKNSKK